MSATRGHLELAAGTALALGGDRWVVQELLPGSGAVVLSGPDGEFRQWPLGRLLTRLRLESGERGRVQQSPQLTDLPDDQVERLRLRVAHALEADCGFRSGDPQCPEPGEPRPQYDPTISTKQQRLRRKAAELKALNPREARRLGLEGVSERTLRRLADAYWESGGIRGCIDGR